MSDAPRQDLEMLKHREFVRGLALKLVVDSNQVDDVVQETWLAAMKNAPRQPRSLRAWLARVTRNLAIRATRSDIRRRQREHRAARQDVAPARSNAATVVERVEMERRVVDAVMALDEPYRTTLLMRFYEDLTPREIASRTDTNASTVRARLSRGLEQVRVRMDVASGGSRRAWMLALTSLLVPSQATAAVTAAATATGGMIVMSAKSKLWVVVAVMLVAGLGVWSLTREGSEPRGPRHTDVANKSAKAPVRQTRPEPEPAEETTIALPGPTAAVVIRVVDGRGNPIPGATVLGRAAQPFLWNVSMNPYEEWYRRAAPRPVFGRAVTGDDGRAQFHPAIERSYYFEARKRNYANGTSSRVQILTVADTRNVTIRLESAHRLTGRVVDESGAPLPHVQVIAAEAAATWSVNSADLGRTKSDEQGRYELRNLPAGPLVLAVSLGGGVPFPVSMIAFPQIDEYTIVVARGGTLHGRVVDASTGQPIGGVRVRVTGQWRHRAQAFTGADGRYRISSLPATELWSVVAEKVGYYDQDNERLGGVPFGRDAVVERNVKLHPAPVLHGTLSGPDGPLGNIAIQAVRYAGPDGVTTVQATTDLEGRYRLTPMPGRAALQVSSRNLQFKDWRWLHPSQAKGDEEWIVEMPKTGTVRRDFVLVWNPIVAGGASVEGRVEDANGQPIGGARVWSMSSALSGPDGRFVLTHLPPGNRAVHAQKEGYKLRNPYPLLVPDSGTVSDVILVLDAAKKLRGHVGGGGREPYVLLGLWPDHLSRGQPMAKADEWSRLWLSARRLSVAEDGSFELFLPNTGRAFLRAGAIDRVPSKPMEITASTDRLAFVLKPGRTIEGRVRDRDTRTPIAGAAVHVRPDPDDNPYGHRAEFRDPEKVVRAVTDANGRFVVPLVEGDCKLRVEVRGYLVAYTVASAGTGDVEIDVDKDLPVRGVVRFRDGAWAEGLAVRLHNLEGKPFWKTARTDATGAFSLAGLPRASYRVTVGGKTARTFTSRVVEPGAEMEITVERAEANEGEEYPEPIQGRGEIRGRVLNQEGVGLPGYRVLVRHEKNDKPGYVSRQTKTDSDGGFEIVGLAEGTYEVSAVGVGRAQPILKSGVATDAVLEFRFGSIAGRVRRDDGASLKGCTMLAFQGAVRRPVGEGAIAADGTFRISGLAGGRYRLEVRDLRLQNYLLGPHRECEMGVRDLELVASLGASIRLHTVDDKDKVVALAWAQAKAPDGTLVRARGSLHGRIVITGLIADVAYTVSVHKQGLIPVELGAVQPARGEQRVVMETGLSVTGVVRSKSGDPLRNTSLRFLHSDGAFTVNGRTGDHARFDVSGFRAGQYAVSVFAFENGKGVWIPSGSVRAGTQDITLRKSR